ncbi:MAG: HAAS signaling domain-containing protein [Phycicoccus sp.]
MNTVDARIGSYLDDLARMLTDLDPAERDDVLAGVREHLDAVVVESAGDPRAVDDALLRLGPPERVAAEARFGSRPAIEAVAPGVRRLRWSRAAGVLSLALAVLPVLTTLSTWVAELPADGVDQGWPDSVALLAHPSEALILALLLFPLWVVGLTVVLTGPGLRPRTKASLAAVGPTTAVLSASSTPLALVGLAAVLVWVVVTGRQVLRETRA